MARWPDFFLVGAPKCATGTIYELLGRQPQLFLAPKDVHFFAPDLPTTQPPLSRAEYEARFKGAPAGAKLGDAAVGYLCSEVAAGEIHALRPDAKIVIALRNPLDAIPSLHQHCLYYGIEEIEDLGAALEAEEDRARGRRLPRRCAHPWMLRYRHVYKYAGQVQRYFDAFGRPRCHVVVYDDFRADPARAMEAVRSFLELPPAEPAKRGAADPGSVRVNRARRARSRRLSALLTDPPPLARRVVRGLTPQPLRRRVAERVLAVNTAAGGGRPELDPEVRAELAASFAAEVDRTSELLDRDLSEWLRPPRGTAETTR